MENLTFLNGDIKIMSCALQAPCIDSISYSLKQKMFLFNICKSKKNKKHSHINKSAVER